MYCPGHIRYCYYNPNTHFVNAEMYIFVEVTFICQMLQARALILNRTLEIAASF